MSVTVIFLCFLVAALLAMGLWLLRLNRHEPDILADPEQLLSELTEVRAYDPMTRLFSDEDLKFVEQKNPALVGHFLRKRRRATVLFLVEARQDFCRAWSVCRLLAPVSEDPDLGVDLFGQLLAFHNHYFRLRLSCLMIGSYGHATNDSIRSLVDALCSLRATAAHVLEVNELQATSMARA